MNPSRSFKVRSGDVEIAASEYGLPQGPTLVLVHGYPDSSTVWQHMLEPLGQQFRVITYDVRGCGLSSAPARRRDYRLEYLARDFKAVIDAASPNAPVHVVAHDWGSIQSWEAVSDPAMQSRIRSFTTISGPCLDHVGYWMRDGIASLSPAQWAAVSGQFIHSWYIWMFQLPLLSPLLWKWVLGSRWHQMLARSQGVQAAPSATQLRDGINGIELYRANIGRVACPQQRRTGVPVQQIVPVNDDFITPAVVRECVLPWVDQLWSREIAATHWAPLSHGDLLAQQVKEFVDFIEGGQESAALQRARVATSPRCSGSRSTATLSGSIQGTAD